MINRRLLFLCGAWGTLAGCLPEARAQVIVTKSVTTVRAPFAGASSNGTVPTKTTAVPRPAVLRWNNGETASGETVEATGTDLTWKTPLFEDPLLLDWHALHRIDQALPSSAPVGPFRFVLRDGSHLYGDLGGISAETVTVHSERCGDLILPRPQVLAVRRIKGAALVYAGPLGESGWVPVPNEASDNGRRQGTTSGTLGNVPTLLTGPGGALALPFFGRAGTLALPLPPRAEVEFRVHAKDAPAFQITLRGGGKRRLRVETWGDELVLAADDFFESIRKLDPKEHDVALRVCWDQEARRCEIYTPAGNLLKQCALPEQKAGGSDTGLTVQNKGRDLSLDVLRVRAWDGQPLAVTDPGQGRVELDDGRVVIATVNGTEGGALTVPAPDGGPAASFPLEAVDAVVFSGETPSGDPHVPTLTYTDGTLLRGAVAGIKDGRVSLKTAFTAAPLAARTDALRCLFLPVAEPGALSALKTLDKLVTPETTLHGRIFAATGDAFLRWTPVGGERPALPAKTLPMEITRFTDPHAAAMGPGALFYTRMGDLLPGTLHGLNREELEFDSPMVETKTLPAGEWQAVQFNVAVRGAIQGFNAPGWQIIKKGGEKSPASGDSLVLSEGSRAAHPAAMLNGEVKFSYDTTNFSFVRLRLFCDGLDPARSLNYMIFRSGNQISSGIEAQEGDFSSRYSNVAPSGPVRVRLVVNESGVRCYFNDNLMDTVAFPAEKRAGSGLIIEPASAWGNAVTDIALSKFSASTDPGQNFFQDVNPDAKAQALTVPRFRKEDLPRHALLATNGDLVRGEIEAITNTQFGFRIGLETLRVPRERVMAVIALQKPTDAAPPPDENGAVLKLLARTLDQRMGYGSANFSTLIEVVKQAVPELKFKLPAEDDSAGVQYYFYNKSVGAVLDELCDQFGLRYRVEKGAVVVEEKSTGDREPMLRKPYWLKAHAFSEKEPAAETLAAKGIVFPSGADAQWQESSRCLEVTNTAANHDKLADLLGREYGPVTPPPTHWLQLANGGRIALTVEKFAPEAISGTHPVYGRCVVPMSEVYSVRNTLPEPSAAGRAVGGWRLAYAPEPVLPESGGGGEGSALLGKDAPAFKLAMLGGGDFDLGEQKGRVVVLDFWATWCGPCIKSLPGLIEAMAQFPEDQVKLIGLNQAEAPEQVKRFLETRGWKLAVAMDAGQNVARQYGVDGIPHTVVIGPDGKVAWVQTGYSADGETAVAEAVKKLLATAGHGATTASVPPPEITGK